MTVKDALDYLPEAPPVARSVAGYELSGWQALYAPAATPQPVLDKLHAAMNKIMADPDMKQKTSAIGLLPIDPPSMPDTVKYLASEREKWGSLVRKLGLEGSQ